jgi:hypothetical protein
VAGKQSALARLSQLLAEHPHSPGSLRVPVTLGDLRELRDRIDWLTAECESADDRDAT